MQENASRWGAKMITASLPAPENRSVRLGVARDLTQPDDSTYFILSQLLDQVPRLRPMLAMAELEGPIITSPQDQPDLVRELKAVGALSPDAPATTKVVSFVSAASKLANFGSMYDMANTFFELGLSDHSITESVVGSPWSEPQPVDPERSARAQVAARTRWDGMATGVGATGAGAAAGGSTWGLGRGLLSSAAGPSSGRGGGSAGAEGATGGRAGAAGAVAGRRQQQQPVEGSMLIYPEPFHFPLELNLRIARCKLPGLLNTSLSAATASRVQLEFRDYRGWCTNHNAVGRNAAYRAVKDSTYHGLQKTASAFLGHALNVSRVPPHLLTFKLATNPMAKLDHMEQWLASAYMTCKGTQPLARTAAPGSIDPDDPEYPADPTAEDISQFSEHLLTELCTQVESGGDFLSENTISLCLATVVWLLLSGDMIPTLRPVAVRLLSIPGCTRCLEPGCQKRQCPGNTLKVLSNGVVKLELVHFKVEGRRAEALRVLLPEDMSELVTFYLARVRPALAPSREEDPGSLLLTPTGKVFSESSLSIFFKNIQSKYGAPWPTPRSYLSFRHGYATSSYKNLIQRLHKYALEEVAPKAAIMGHTANTHVNHYVLGLGSMHRAAAMEEAAASRRRTMEQARWEKAKTAGEGGGGDGEEEEEEEGEDEEEEEEEEEEEGDEGGRGGGRGGKRKRGGRQ
ncbi:hypothetical protein HYH02_011446 [Chlamydomonas schloesseri]|uniref:Uncharacterized protein n=1 Tax=Chlamydomonas schloesseri TaxID=2026947 RepID=A0A835TFU6_9CHLO|nr:hypothetical protein HYH02_011446 [Chlamydomonas schloesseri]|eukprot:KAG2437015.1 hypothetical protein HYH02_011446 [Chlamydomonas schloesseri]